MTIRRVFLSYHHAIDQAAREQFERSFGGGAAFISGSVGDGDIGDGLRTETIRQTIRDKYLRNSTVTIVLVGPETWKRKHVDWEIGSSIRRTEKNPRSGLLGIILPSYYKRYYGGQTGTYGHYSIPPRLHDNIQNGYAAIYDWPRSSASLRELIEDAYQRARTKNPDNSRPQYKNNRSGDRWND